MSEDGRYPLEDEIFKSVVRKFAKAYEVEVRPGLDIIDRQGGSVIKHGEKTYNLESCPHDLRSEILEAINAYKEGARALGRSKYLDPKTNPMIKTDKD